MNFQDQIQQIFGTTDIHELKQISRDADNYRCLNADMNNSIISEKKKNTGRKNSFTEEQLAHILALQDRGEKITDIARQYHVSRQTIYSQIKRAYNFSDDPDVKMRMNFMNHGSRFCSHGNRRFQGCGGTDQKTVQGLRNAPYPDFYIYQ